MTSTNKINIKHRHKRHKLQAQAQAQAITGDRHKRLQATGTSDYNLYK